MLLAGDPRWEAMQELITKHIEALESMFNIDPVHDTPETIGFRYMALTNVIAHLKFVSQLPETLLEAKKIHEKGTTKSRT